ncbi:MAG: ferritin-like domain-containing protein [Polyangiaceae bacterium]
MSFALRRATGDDDLELSRAHAIITRPRRGTIGWDAFDSSIFAGETLAEAAVAWSGRAVQEYHSLALFTQLASQIHLLGAPLDWSGAFARMIADEVRHTEICARMGEVLGAKGPVVIEPSELHLVPATTSLRAHVRETIVAAFCIGETLSGRMFRQCLRAATVPLARAAVRAIVIDETFHAAFGWEAAALLMRDDGPEFARERTALAASLPVLFNHYARLACATKGSEWAASEAQAQPAPNFGTLTHAGYAHAFFEGMRDDVVPGLVAIGLPEAVEAFRDLRPVRNQ